MMRWNDVQRDATAWLESGRHMLAASPQYTDHKRLEKRTGNYRLTGLEQDGIVGESNNLRKRAKRLLKLPLNQTGDSSKAIIQVSYTDFGRKELEEVSIATDRSLKNHEPNKPDKLNKPNNLDTPDNLDNLDTLDNFDWEELQAESLDLLAQGFQQLEYVRPREWMARQVDPIAGIYLVFKQEELLYIQHSDNVLQSLNIHSNNTPVSSFRRAIASYELGLELKTAEEVGKGNLHQTAYERHHLELNDNFAINYYLQDCLVVNLPVTIGRIELAEALTKYFAPKLMIKQRSIS